MVLAGYGIAAPELEYDDYRGKDVKGAVVLVRRFTPEGKPFEDGRNRRRYGDLRQKAFEAHRRGAVALLVVDAPERPSQTSKPRPPVEEAKLPALEPSGQGDAGMPVVAVTRAAAAELVKHLERGKKARAELEVRLTPKITQAFNVVGRIPSKIPEGEGRRARRDRDWRAL